jgi:hypothetical protein
MSAEEAQAVIWGLGIVIALLASLLVVTVVGTWRHG